MSTPPYYYLDLKYALDDALEALTQARQALELLYDESAGKAPGVPQCLTHIRAALTHLEHGVPAPVREQMTLEEAAYEAETDRYDSTR